MVQAATRIDPQLPMMVGMEGSLGDTIEVGYNLRRFCRPDLECPGRAFPGDPHLVALLAPSPLTVPGSLTSRQHRLQRPHYGRLPVMLQGSDCSGEKIVIGRKQWVASF